MANPPKDMTPQQRRAFMERNLKMTMAFVESPTAQFELKKMLDKVLPLQYEFRDGHLFVGSEYPPKHEVRRALGGGEVYCKCPDWTMRQRKDVDGGKMCKHVLMALAMDLDIPETGVGSIPSRATPAHSPAHNGGKAHK